MQVSLDEVSQLPTRLHMDLPSEVWDKIAATMATKDLAKACGTCKAFSAVRPKILQLVQRKRKQNEIEWGLRHGSEAIDLKLYVEDSHWDKVRPRACLPDLKRLLALLFVTAFLPNFAAELGTNCQESSEVALPARPIIRGF